MSPDWSAKAEPVPYAKLASPQTLNLYSYVENNPITGSDPDGHYRAAWLGVGLDDVGGRMGGDGSLAAAEMLSNELFAQQTTQDAKKAQQTSPDPNYPVSNTYVLAVINDSDSKMDEWDTRLVDYSLHTAPTKDAPDGKPVDGDVYIQEHQSNPKLQGDGPSHGSVFHDAIGPHRSTSGTVISDRYFTVAVNGKIVGVVPIHDKDGNHTVDHIAIDSNHDRTQLNGHYDSTAY